MRNIFFGWWVLVGLFIIYAASNGIVLNTLPLFYPELMGEFGWNQAEVTQPVSLFYLATAIASPIGGALLDRWSAKTLMLIGLAMIVAALSAIPFIRTLWHLTAIYLVFSAGLAIGGLIPSMVLLTRWFVRYRGLAIGTLLMATNLGGAVFALMVRDTLVNDGWRQAIIELSIVGALMMLIPVLFLIRNQPQDMGLIPDGADDEDNASAMAQATEQSVDGPTLIQAVKTPVFYLLAFVTAVMWFCIVGLLQHQAIYLDQDLGVDVSTRTLIVSLFFWSAVTGNVTFGYLSDHFDKGNIMLVAVICLTLGLSLLRFADAGEVVMIYAFAVVWGLGYSGTFTMMQLMIAEYFSGHSYGKILGVFTFVDTLAGSMGAILLGVMRVALDSYIPSINLMIGLCAASIVIVIILNRTKEVAIAKMRA